MDRGVQSRVSENSDIRISDIRNFGYQISLSEHISEISDIRNFRIPEIGYPKYPNFKRKKEILDFFGFFRIFSDIENRFLDFFG